MALTIVEARAITGGVDTHADTHVAAALEPVGGLLGVREFTTTPAGYAGPVAEIPGDISPRPLTRPLILFAVIRAIAVSIAVAISFGLKLPSADWMPIAAIVAMKPSLSNPPSSPSSAWPGRSWPPRWRPWSCWPSTTESRSK